MFEVEYEDGTRKTVDVDINECEALFWSDQAVLDVYAPYYNKPRVLTSDEQTELEDATGIKTSEVTPETVKNLWTKVQANNDVNQPPAVILKKRKSIPHVKCVRAC